MKGAWVVLLGTVVLASCDGAVTSPGSKTSEDLAFAAAGKRIVVSGSGHITATGQETDWRTFAFHARLEADGTADGTFLIQARQNDPNTTSHGVIECVAVVGNQAWMVARITKSNSPVSPPGTYARFRVVDNGEGANDPPDQISLAGVGFPTPPPYCTNRPLQPALIPIEAGNIQIH